MKSTLKSTEAQIKATAKYINAQERCFIKIPISVFQTFEQMWGVYEGQFDTLNERSSINGAIKTLLSCFYYDKEIQERILENDNAYERYSWDRNDTLKSINLLFPKSTRLKVFNIIMPEEYQIHTTDENWEEHLNSIGNPIPNIVKLLIGDFIKNNQEWQEPLEQAFRIKRLNSFSKKKRLDPNEEYRASGLPNLIIKQIISIANECQIKGLRLYGSRADGTFKRKSDINLSVTDGNIDVFKERLDDEVDTLLPFTVVNALTANNKLKEAIKNGFTLI